MQMTNFSDIIDTAIRREEEAYVFYRELEGRIADTDARETIAWIATEEQKHRAFLVKYRDDHDGPGDLERREAIVYKIAEYLQEPSIVSDMNSAEVYLVAAHRELRSHRFYSQLAELHTSGETRQMLLKMAAEELKHKEKMEYLYTNTAFPQTSGG